MSIPSKYSLARGLTFRVPTHASQSLVTHPGGVSTLLSYHARGSPLVMALSWVLSVPGSPSSGVGTSRVRLLPTGTRTYGLEATFLFSLLLFCMVEAQSLSGDVFTRRCLSWATPHLGDASARRWLERSTCWLLFLGSLEGSHHDGRGPSTRAKSRASKIKLGASKTKLGVSKTS